MPVVFSLYGLKVALTAVVFCKRPIGMEWGIDKSKGIVVAENCEG
jgi:hypothetical protein